MSWPERPEDRYHRDPVFARLVDLFGSFLEENGCRNWTPTELREAVMLAACKYEYSHIRPIVIRKGDTDSLMIEPPPKHPWRKD